MKLPSIFHNRLKDSRFKAAEKRYRRKLKILTSLEKQDENTLAAIEHLEIERGRWLETYAKSE